MSPIRQYETGPGSGLLCHISGHKKNTHKISRGTLVIITDTAFRFSLFSIFFLPLFPSLFYYVIKFVGLTALTLLICLINALDLHVLSIAKQYVCVCGGGGYMIP